MASSVDDEDVSFDLFQEPDNYFKPKAPPHYVEHNLLSGQPLRLRLVGSDPLWVLDPGLPPPEPWFAVLRWLRVLLH